MAGGRRRGTVAPFARRLARGDRRRPGHRAPPRALLILPGAAAALFLIAPLVDDALDGADAAENGCRIVNVIDGDTVRIRCPGERVHSARLMGFDTPEVFSPRCASEAARGEKATAALERLIGAAGGISIDRRGVDRYERDLAVMRLDGVDVARTMIEAGHARAYHGGRRKGWCRGAAQ